MLRTAQRIALPNRSTESAPRIVFRGEEQRPEDAAALATAVGISPLVAQILLRRGIGTAEQARRFLAPTLKESIPDPNQILGMTRAGEVILTAVRERKQITVYSDFDVDGITSGSQLYLFLRGIGAHVNHYAPNRFTEGYGLVMPAVEKLIQANTQLLVTVDCGITNLREVRRARQAGMQVVIIDHHEPHEIPEAEAIVDPAQPGCPFQHYRLCAAGLVWMLLVVLRQQLRSDTSFEGSLPDPKDFLDLAALGTICDMVPLRDVNRVIAARGLDALRATPRPGVVALKQISSAPLNHRFAAGHVGFALGPRINAAGRMGDAKEAFDLLTTGDSRRAELLARKLDGYNLARQEQEASMKELCLKQVLESEELLARPAIALFDRSFHVGVIGIVAQRLVEFFHKPTAIMAPGEVAIGGVMTKVIKGSVRSIPGFHVADALQTLTHLLIAHGGHAEAGGFTLSYENLERFQLAFSDAAEGALSGEDRRRTLTADLEVSLREIDFQAVTDIEKLAPFGVGNPTPQFITRGVAVDSVTLLGEKHLRLRFKQGNYFTAAVGWNMQGHPLLQPGKTVSIIYAPELNSYQGISTVQLSLKDVWEDHD